MLIQYLWLLNSLVQSHEIIPNHISSLLKSVGASWLAYWLDSLDSKDRLYKRVRNFSSLQNVHRGSAATLASYSLDAGVHSGGKVDGTWR